jgi:hypothetical protein
MFYYTNFEKIDNFHLKKSFKVLRHVASFFVQCHNWQHGIMKSRSCWSLITLKLGILKTAFRWPSIIVLMLNDYRIALAFADFCWPLRKFDLCLQVKTNKLIFVTSFNAQTNKLEHNLQLIFVFSFSFFIFCSFFTFV